MKSSSSTKHLKFDENIFSNLQNEQWVNTPYPEKTPEMNNLKTKIPVWTGHSKKQNYYTEGEKGKWIVKRKYWAGNWQIKKFRKKA